MVNCAGISVLGRLITKKGVIDTSSVENLFKINVIGTLNVAKYAAKRMSEQNLNG